MRKEVKNKMTSKCENCNKEVKGWRWMNQEEISQAMRGICPHVFCSFECEQA